MQVKLGRYTLLLLGLIAIPYLVPCVVPELILLRESTPAKLKSFLCGVRVYRFLFRYLFSAFYLFNLDQQLRSLDGVGPCRA